MKKYILIYIFLLTSSSNAQWIRQDVVPGFSAADVRFINKSTGWICGDNRIFKTTNSGFNWIQQPNPSLSALWGIHPVNENVVYACGYCTILKTTNGGENWIGIRLGVLPCNEQTYWGLWFNDERTGWFCSRQGYVIRTIDGCKTLIDSFRVPGALWDVHFKNDTSGVMVGGTNAQRTTNAGVNWYPVPIPSTFITPTIYSETFVGDTGWCISFGNVVYKTSNYGNSWDSLTLLQSAFQAESYSIEFSSKLIGYAGCNDRKIFKTINGGLNWREEPTAQFGPATYGGIYAYNDSIVWAAGGLGFVLYTTTGGLTEAKQISSLIPDNYKLHQNYPNPFNSQTKIKYEIKEKAKIKIIVTDIGGRLISILVDGEQSQGEYEISINRDLLASGIYFYRLQADNFSQTKRMILLK